MTYIPYSPIFANRLSARAGNIYFIQAGPFVKVGHTEGCVFGRKKSLQVGCPYPMKIRLVVDGSRADERSLHKTFGELWESGEWFRFEGALQKFIEDNEPVVP